MKKMISFEVEYTKETWYAEVSDYDFGWKSEMYETLEECLEKGFVGYYKSNKENLINNLIMIINGKGFVKEIYQEKDYDVKLIHIYYK